MVHFQDDEGEKPYSDKMELQILELKKTPEEIQTGEDIVKWMRFFRGIRLAVEEIRLHDQGVPDGEIAIQCDTPVERVWEILAM